MLNKKITAIKKGKTAVCLFLILICFFAYFMSAPVVKDLAYKFSIPYVNTEAENLVFYKYKVFGTENSFNKNFSSFVEQEKNELKAKDEFIVVKIQGEYLLEQKSDYIIIREESVPDLNVEIYITKNIDIAGNSLPCKTTILLLQKIVRIVFLVLFSILLIVSYISILRGVIIKSRDCRVNFYLFAKNRINKYKNFS